MEKKDQHSKDVWKFLTARRKLSELTILIPVIVFEVLNLCTSFSARSKEIIHLGVGELPVTSLTRFSLEFRIFPMLLCLKIFFSAPLSSIFLLHWDCLLLPIFQIFRLGLPRVNT